MAGHASNFLLVTILVIVLILLIFGMKYFAALRTAQLRVTGEDAYRDIAERAMRAQEETAQALAAVTERVGAIDAGLKRVEAVLKDVG